MVKDNPPETPPPGAGFTTETVGVPVAVRKLAGIAAVISVELTSVVAQFVPFHCTCDVPINPLPVTDKVNAPELITADAGWSAEATGAGLEVIAKDMPPDSPPPGVGFMTVTVAAPDVLRSAAVMAAVNWAELTKVVVRFDPFHCTCDEARKPVPLTVMVNAAEFAAAAAGEITLSAGVGFPIVKLKPPDAPLPGAGFDTVTVATPALPRSVAVMATVNCVELT